MDFRTVHLKTLKKNMNKEWKQEIRWVAAFLVASVVIIIVGSFLVFESSLNLILHNGLPFSITTCWITFVIGRYFLIALNRLISKSYVISLVLAFFVLLIIIKYIPDLGEFPTGYFSIPLPDNAGPFYGHYMLFDYYYRTHVEFVLLLLTEVWLAVRGIGLFKKRNFGMVTDAR